MARQTAGRAWVGGFWAQPLEPRRLLANIVSSIQIGTSLQGTEYDTSSSITVLPGQPVQFTVQVTTTNQDYGNTNAPDGSTLPPGATGNVDIHWREDSGVVTTVALSAPTEDAYGDEVSTATGTISLPEADAPNATDSSGLPLSFVYADYRGDSNYAEKLSVEDNSLPDEEGEYVGVNFAATHFAFTQEPSDAPADSAITPAPTVALEDAGGAIDPYYDSAVVLTTTGAGGTLVAPTSTTSGETYAPGGVYGGTGGQTFNPTLSVTAVNGVATFSDVELSAAGTYTLGNPDPDPASDVAGFLSAATSTPFTVVAGDKLAFGQLPSNGTAKEAITPAVTVDIENPDGSVQTADSTTVVTLATVGVTGEAAITGNTATAVDGVATFPDLTVPDPGLYQFEATDSGGDAAAYTPSKITIAGNHLVFKGLPAVADPGDRFTFKILVEDSKGQLVDTDDAVDLTETLQSNPAATATKTFTTRGGGINAVSTLTTSGAYTFEATDTTAAGAVQDVTATVTVKGDHLVFKALPDVVEAADPFKFKILVENSKGQLVDVDDDVTLTETSQAVPAASATKTFTTNGGGINAVSTLVTPGAYTFEATDTSAPAGTVQDVTATVTVKGDHLVFKALPAVVDTADRFSFKILIENSKGRLVDADDDVTLTETAQGNPAASATKTFTANGGGINAVSTLVTPGAYTFQATDTSAAPGTVQDVTATVTVKGDHLVFKGLPAVVHGGTHFNTKILIENSKGQLVDADDDVTLTETAQGDPAASASNTFTANGGGISAGSTLVTPGAYTFQATDTSAPPGTVEDVTATVTVKGNT